MLAALAFLLFFVAGILKLTGSHLDLIQWLLIVGGLVLSAAVVAYLRGWRDPLYRPRS